MLRRIAQQLRDLRLRSIHLGRDGSLKTRILARLEREILRFADPTIVYRLGRTNLSMPLSHQLPIYMSSLAHYNRNLSRIAAAVKARYPTMTAVDVGANVGDSVAMLWGDDSFPVLCVEGDERYFKFLTENTRSFPTIRRVRAYLGAANQVMNVQAQNAQGTGRLLGSAAPGVSISLVTLDEVLEIEADFAAAKLLKIDTDGYDSTILKGAGAFLERAKPVVFFEYHPHLARGQDPQLPLVFDRFAGAGYRGVLVYDNLGIFESATDCTDTPTLSAMHARHLRSNGASYADVAVFHSDDQTLFEEIGASETNYFRSIGPHTG